MYTVDELIAKLTEIRNQHDSRGVTYGDFFVRIETADRFQGEPIENITVVERGLGYVVLSK